MKTITIYVVLAALISMVSCNQKKENHPLESENIELNKVKVEEIVKKEPVKVDSPNPEQGTKELGKVDSISSQIELDELNEYPCFEFEPLELPYSNKIDFKTVEYDSIICDINGISNWICDQEKMRCLPLLKKDDLSLILVPADCGDFPYRYYLLTINGKDIVSNLYVEGEWCEPGSEEFVERTSFEIDTNYTITVNTENVLAEEGKNEKKSYKLLEGGKLSEPF